ncbi:MAG: RICIN domain-containing protein, partial [Myxococcales bacterium]|nr:RICIN domain-containing protein [Myxococcales bacterium]
MDFLVTPLAPFSANAPGRPGSDQRVFAIASEHSSLVLSLREELSWAQVPGGLIHVSVGADGTTWGVNKNHQIYRWSGSTWAQVPGALKQISVGSSAHVWGVNVNDDIYRWTGSGWQQIGGKLKYVGVGADGTVWGVNSNDDIYFRRGDTWENIAGKLKQIEVGSRTLVWGVNSNDDIFVRRGDHWLQIGGKLKHVSVAADGSVWGVNAADQIWRWRGGGWEQMPGGLKQISVGTGSNVWGVNAADQIWRNQGAGHGRLVQEIWTEDRRQQWRFIPQDDGTHQILNVGTGKVLDVRGASTADGADVLGWTWHGGNNQRWRVQDLGDGRFRIDAKHSGKSLDVYRAGLEAGTTIIQWPWHGGGNQRWRVSEIKPIGEMYEARASIYEHANYQGAALQLGVGTFDIEDIGKVGNDKVSSVRVPDGLRVTLFEHARFAGRRKVFTSDTSYVGNDFNDIASGVVVEKVVRIFEHANFQGRSSVLGIGKHDINGLGIPNDSLSSLKVPQGLVVIMYEHANFEGMQRVYFEDSSFVGNDWNDKVSSIVVRQLGVAIPRDAVRFGGRINLRSHHGKWLVAESDGRLNANRPHAQTWETFTVERTGPTQHLSHLCWGDTVSLKSFHGKYVVAESNGAANANRAAVGAWERLPMRWCA